MRIWTTSAWLAGGTAASQWDQSGAAAHPERAARPRAWGEPPPGGQGSELWPSTRAPLLSARGRAELREGGGNGGGGGRGGEGGGDLAGGGGGGEGFRGGGGLKRGGGGEGGEGGGGILRGGGGGGDGGFGGGGGGGGNGSSLPLNIFIFPGNGGVAAGLTPVSQPHMPPNQLELGGGGGGAATAGARRASYLRRGICAAPLRPRWRRLGAPVEQKAAGAVRAPRAVGAAHGGGV